MKHTMVFVALTLIGLLASVRGEGQAQTRMIQAGSACEETACLALEARLAPLKASYHHRPQEIPYPEESSFTQARHDLGRALFFDPLLSKTKTTSCATCHNPGLAWEQGTRRAIGDTGESLPLRAPTLLNVAWLPILGWDGKFADIEAVTFVAILGSNNMGLDEPTVIARLSGIPAYVDAFSRAYGDPKITRERIEDATATFERSLVSTPAPFDRWLDGDTRAISAAAKHGFDLFNGKAGCAECHSGWAFTDGSFHDIGSATGDDIGRGALFPSSIKLQHAFKVPTLRDVTRRGPYMHNGEIATLDGVIDLYDRGGIDRPSRSPKIRPLHLTDDEKHDLIAFLTSLTSDPTDFAVPTLPR